MTTALLVCTAVLLALWLWRERAAAGPSVPGGAIVFVRPGQSFAITARQLEAAGVVRSHWAVAFWARWLGRDRLAGSGEFRFADPLSITQVIDRLTDPAAGLHKVTVPEGSSVVEIANAFAAAGFGGSDQFLCAARDPEFLARLGLPASGAEGYLFPDTYSLSWGVEPAEVLRAMVDNFRGSMSRLNRQRQQAPLSEHELVTLASIIERETAVADERGLVSAVFRNRLLLGMRLQADPTTVYGRATRTAPSATDLESDSPYNTYLHGGLPPGPICSPGRAALAAAAAPAEVDYLYFVARGDGSHAFARTLEEHNRNVAALRRRH